MCVCVCVSECMYDVCMGSGVRILQLLTTINPHNSSSECKGHSISGGDIDDPIKEIVVSLRVGYEVALVINRLQQTIQYNIIVQYTH